MPPSKRYLRLKPGLVSGFGRSDSLEAIQDIKGACDSVCSDPDG